MSFFKEFKEDLQQAVNELLPDEGKDGSNDQMVNTLDSNTNLQSTEEESEKMKELLEKIASDGTEAAAGGAEASEDAKADTNENAAIDDNVDQELLDTLNDDEKESKQAEAQAQEEEASAGKDETVGEAATVQKARPAAVNEDDVTVITKGTKINGSISTDGSLDIRGTVIGDIDCLGKLSVTGHVKGNSSAAEVYINTDRFEGCIKSDESVKIALGTVVIGDITASSAVFAGAVKGEIDVNGPVVIDSTAIIKGNVKAKSVQVNNGAIIDGYCSLAYADVNIDNIFE